jgi:ribosomal-protein-alanine N-acetyltransferase
MNKELLYRLESQNIYFKRLAAEDAEHIHSFASDTDVSRFIGWRLMNTLDDTRKHVEEMLQNEKAGTHQYASVVLKASGEIIGTAIIFNFDWEARHAEIGYVFDKNHWGRSYGTQTVTMMSRFAFDALDLHRLHALVADANAASARVLEKNGFELEGRLRDHYFIENKYYDGLIFGKLQAGPGSRGLE